MRSKNRIKGNPIKWNREYIIVYLYKTVLNFIKEEY